ncbi:TniQ family protein [Celeribacter halophilus]|uniref:TniQ family protein n=1 Tax=Celeribacter halophilus TaxID=576117 RepID=UPI003A8FC528
MPLLPKLEALPEESMTSYLNRVARFHGNVPLPKFLNMIELPRHEILAPGPKTIARVSRLTGAQVWRLERMTFLHIGQRRRSIGGQLVQAEFVDTGTRRFCPRCLLEDLALDSPSDGMPVGRIVWQIKATQVCHRHNLVLKKRSINAYPDRFKNLPELIESETELAQLAASAEYCKTSALQGYMMKRIAGVKGPDWLDDQPLDVAVKACELLGMLLIGQPGTDLEKLAPVQRIVAQDEGYEYAKAGPVGLLKAFQVIYDQYVETGKSGGDLKVFGSLYHWPYLSKPNEDPNSFRSLLREFILEHFAVPEGVILLGEPVDRQRVHTIRSLAGKARVKVEALRISLVHAGLIADVNERNLHNQVFDARAGESVAERMRSSISTKRLEPFLNCTRVQAEQLTRSGTIPRLVPVGEACRGVLTNVAREDAETFLAKLMGQAVRVPKPSEGFLDIAGTAEVLHRPALDIVVTILDGFLERVETCQPRRKFKSLYVHPEDVRRALSYNPPDGFMTVGQAADKLGLPPDSIYALSACRDVAGKPIFTEHFFDNSGSAKQRMIAVKEVVEFSERFISLKEYSEMVGIGPKGASKKLRNEGILPIAPREIVLRAIYDRQEVLELVDS